MDNTDDTIDLLDLFLVFVKRRKFLLVFMSIVILLVAIWFFVAPTREYRAYEAAKTKQSGPEILDSHEVYMDSVVLSLNEDLEWYTGKLYPGSDRNRSITLFNDWLQSTVQDTEFIADSVESLEIDSETMSSHISERMENLDFDDFMDYKWFYNASLEEANLILKILYTYQGAEEWSVVLEELAAALNQFVTVEMASELRSDINIWSSVELREIPAGVLSRISTASSVLAGTTDPLIVISQEVQALDDVADNMTINSLRLSYLKKAIIIIFAALFLSIFLAFILEFLENIRKDEERMKKIKDALK